MFSTLIPFNEVNVLSQQHDYNLLKSAAVKYVHVIMRAYLRST